MVTDLQPPTTTSPPPATPSMSQPVGLKQSLWWMVFLADTVSLSMALKHFKAFTLAPGVQTGLWFAISLVAIIGLTGALVYDGYAKEKQKGNLKNTFGLFEWIYTQQTSSSTHTRTVSPTGDLS